MDKEKPDRSELEKELICIVQMEPYQVEMLAELENLRAMGVAVAAHSKQRDVGKSILQNLATEIPAPAADEPEPKAPKNRGPQPRRAYPVPR